MVVGQALNVVRGLNAIPIYFVILLLIEGEVADCWLLGFWTVNRPEENALQRFSMVFERFHFFYCMIKKLAINCRERYDTPYMQLTLQSYL